MPSKGQPRITVRLPRELLKACKRYLASLTFAGDSSPPTMSDLVIEALLEKLHHRRRSAGERSRRPTSSPPDPGDRRRVDGRLLADDDDNPETIN
jgi:hypothetical protein